jgi:hypothetical protein
MTAVSSPYFELLTLRAVLVASSVHFILGGLWYSHLLFGKGFVKYAFRSKSPEPNLRALAAAATGSLLQSPFILFYLSAVGVRNANEGCVYGFALGFFDCALHLSHGLFENRPFQLFVIHQGYHIVSLIVTCSILGAIFGLQ